MPKSCTPKQFSTTLDAIKFTTIIANIRQYKNSVFFAILLLSDVFVGFVSNFIVGILDFTLFVISPATDAEWRLRRCR